MKLCITCMIRQGILSGVTSSLGLMHITSSVWTTDSIGRLSVRSIERKVKIFKMLRLFNRKDLAVSKKSITFAMSNGEWNKKRKITYVCDWLFKLGKETRYQKRRGHIKTRWADCLSALIGRTFEQHFPFFLGLVAQSVRAADFIIWRSQVQFLSGSHVQGWFPC